MITVAIECSTAVATVGFFEGARPLSISESADPKKHSEFLNPALETCRQSAGLKWDQVDRIAVGIGPGSFTGIRVAVNVAKTLAATLGKPLASTHSLELLRKPAHRQNPDQPVLALLNAYRNMVFGALFQDSQQHPTPSCWTMAELTQIVTAPSNGPLLVVGDGWNVIQGVLTPNLSPHLRRDPSFSDFPRAEDLAIWAEENPASSTLDWKMTIPLYIRASAAEENSNTRGSR